MSKINTNFLFRQVNASSLGMLRILYGIFMLVEFVKFHDYFVRILSTSEFFSTYDGFHWVRLFPNTGLNLFFGIMVIATILFTLGIYYRLNAVLTFFGFTYVFLIDHGHYNNHFYLYCMFHLFFIFTDADRWGALDKSKHGQISYWQLFLFKSQIFIVYFFGAVAKFHPDWFQGYPMRYWLHMMSVKFSDPIASMLQTPAAAYFVSYGGFIFDLLIGFMLFSPRLRRFALIPVFTFHLSNHFLWSIGTFPFVMLAACIIFLAPNTPERIMVHLQKQKRTVAFSFVLSLIFLTLGLFHYSSILGLIGLGFGLYYIAHNFRPISFFKWFLPYLPASSDKNSTYNYHNKALVIGLLSSWLLIQAILPFRHWFMVGNPSWTGEGHLFAWRMMLVATTDAVKIKLVIPETGEEVPIALEQYMNFRQFMKLGRTPRTYHKLAHFIRDKAKESGLENPIVKMEIWKSVNERTPRLLNDTTLNYAEVPYVQFANLGWYNDWDQNTDPLEFREEKFQHWENLLKEYEKQN